MTSFRNALIAGVSALGVVAGSMPAMAASAKSEPTVGGVKMSDIQEVRHGWGGGGGGRGWGGGGRGYRSGWGGGGRYYGGYGRHRGYYGGYAAAGILGLAAGAAIASPYRYGYGYGDGYYYDDGYYGRPYSYYDRPYRRGYTRAYYGGAECQVISRQRDRHGYPIKVIRYRPC
ncbi:hypothetical protein ACFQI3_09895 [Hansschlegelia quercus]|uniref:BA14K family protein n=1 Tax=Hansschlegelia quercus TaxID=2528245 RepID=A0A4Q9GQQ9_9HYPH|nr:hypothetical protein [Hansschlegelia quercus]TBN54380.1 hypothetical protein EYR15_05975 [Hansschlegelia quercus]